MPDDARLHAEIDARRAALIALTQDLVRIPTLNPPGRNYRDDLRLSRATTLAPAASTCEMIRAEGRAGRQRHPSALEPRRPARGHAAGRLRPFQRPSRRGRSRPRLDGRSLRRRADGRPHLRPRRLRHEGRHRRQHHRRARPSWPSIPTFAGAIEISATADEESGGFGGVAWLAERGFFSPERVQHVIIPEPLHKDRICLGHRGVWWAEIETKGRIAHGSMPFLGDSAIRHMGAVLAEIEATLYPLLATRHTAMPVIPEGARQSTLNINAIHGGEPRAGGGLHRPARPLRRRPLPHRASTAAS